MSRPGSPAAITPLTSSFRDPNGALFPYQDRIFRIVNQAGLPDLRVFLASPAANKFVTCGSLVSSTTLREDDKQALLRDAAIAGLYAAIGGEVILEHERIPFASYPYEWPPEMLYAAAGLTLDLAIDFLPDGLGLKDATPYNVMFRGPQPVFIDVLSFEHRNPGDPVWVAYAQFVRTFLLPLLASRHFGLSIEQSLLTRRDGLEPEDIYRLLGPWQKLRPPFLSLVSMPAWLAKRHDQDDASIYRAKTLSNPEKARFILLSLLKSLRRTLRSAAPPASVSSTWTGYMESNNYTSEHFAVKDRFVKETLAECAPQAVLDVGCNTGHFSLLAARSGARVVSADYDPAVLGGLWRKAGEEHLDVLPLVVNLTRPTPGTGWRNREWPSFLERARGSFDMVFMLAVIHHMLVTERVPLNDIVDLAAEITTDSLVIEFVSPEDSMFRRLVRGRDELYRGLTVDVFEHQCRRRFDIVRSHHLEGTTRWLYWLRRKKD